MPLRGRLQGARGRANVRLDLGARTSIRESLNRVVTMHSYQFNSNMLTHPARGQVEQSLLRGTGPESPPPDIIIYNAGLPKQACPPCNAGLEQAYGVETGAPVKCIAVSM